MESVLNAITSNKILLIIVILLISLLVYSILKQLVKIIIITIVALALYLGYMNYKGDNMEKNIQEYLNKGEKEFQNIQKKKDALSQILDSVEKISK